MDVINYIKDTYNIPYKLEYQIKDNTLSIYGNDIQTLKLYELLYFRGSESDYEYIVISIPILSDDIIYITIKKIRLLLPVKSELVSHLPNNGLNYYLSNDITILGKGSYGSVVKSGQYAIKTFFPGSTDNPYLDGSLLREITILIRLNHPNIIKLIDVVVGSPDNINSNNVSIILPLANYSLYDYLSKVNLNNAHKLNITWQILKGLEYIHSKDILHGDLKTDNIIIFRDSKEDILKISDFGLSVPSGCDSSSVKGEGYNVYYRPLEIFFGIGYGVPADLWAMGCMIYTIFTSKYLFRSSTDDNLSSDDLKKVVRDRIIISLGDATGEYQPFDDYINHLINYDTLFLELKKNIIKDRSILKNTLKSIQYPDVESVIDLLLQYDPNKRVKISEVLNMKLFKVFNTNSNLLLDDVGCPGILDERQKYQIINPFNESKIFTDLRIQASKRLYEVITELCKKIPKLKLTDYFSIMYIFDYSIHTLIPLNIEEIKLFLVACVEIWYHYRYGGSALGQRRYSEMSKENQIYYKKVNSHVQLILYILDFDIIVTSIGDYINDYKLISNPLYIKSIEQNLVNKYLSNTITKSIEIYNEYPEYFNIIDSLTIRDAQK